MRRGRNMTNEELLETVRKTLGAYTEVSADRIQPEVPLSDLGVDSLTAVGLVADLEAAFGITIPDDEVLAVRTVGDVLERLRAQLGGGRGGAAA